MQDTLRNTVTGQLLRSITANRVLRHPESMPEFALPESIILEKNVSPQHEAETPIYSGEVNLQTLDLEALRTLSQQGPTSHRRLGLNNSTSNAEPDLQENTSSREIIPTLTKDGKLLVTWYTTTDPENPQNWSTGKKSWVSFVIWYLIENDFNTALADYLF